MFNSYQYFTLLEIGEVLVYQTPGNLVSIYFQNYSSYSTELWRKCMGIFNKFHSTIRPKPYWYHSMIQRIVTVCHCSPLWPLRLPYTWSKNINVEQNITLDQHMAVAVSSPLHLFMLVFGWLSPIDWLTKTKFPYENPPIITVPTLSISISSLVCVRVINSIFVLFREVFVRSL